MKQFLGGKVKIKALLVTGQPAGRPETQARLLSPGGEMAVLADGLTAIRHLCWVELLPGKVRGNHFHRLRHESFYLAAGEAELRAQDIATGEECADTLHPGDLVLIDPEIAHAYLPLTAGQAVEWAPEVFDAGDVYRHSPGLTKPAA